MSMVINLLSVTTELRLDPKHPKGRLRAEVIVRRDDGSKDSLKEKISFEDDEKKENGRPPTFQELTSIARDLGGLLIEHPFLKLSLCESPIELTFFFEAMLQIQDLKPQVEVGPYRVDLAIPEKKVAIELDGHEFHKTRLQRTNDAERRIFLQKQGWEVITFTGSQINKDVHQCIEDAKEIIEARPDVDE